METQKITKFEKLQIEGLSQLTKQNYKDCLEMYQTIKDKNKEVKK